MGKGYKTLGAMRANPRDWRMPHIETLCRALDISCEPPSKGSHYKVSHPSQEAILTIPADRPIKPIYIRKLVAFVDAVTGSA
jgi:hypothetical protein